eukprot:1159578-Pelagomonas_calceolata.AAC.5
MHIGADQTPLKTRTPCAHVILLTATCPGAVNRCWSQVLNKYVEDLQTVGAPKPVKLDFSLIEGGAIKPVHVDLSRGGDLYPLFLAFGLIEVSPSTAMVAGWPCMRNKFSQPCPIGVSEVISCTACLSTHCPSCQGTHSAWLQLCTCHAAGNLGLGFS